MSEALSGGRSLEWRIAWRHLRAGERPSPWVDVLTAVAVFILVVGGGFALYASSLSPDVGVGLEAGDFGGGDFFEGSYSTEMQRYYGTFGGASIAVGTMLMVFALMSRFFNLLATIITTSVMLGCMALVVVLSLMTGLEADLRDKILAQKAHIRVSGTDGNRFSDYDEVVTSLRDLETVVGASPYLEDEIMVRSGLNRQGAVLLGIRPDELVEVSNLPEIMKEGSYESLEHPDEIPELDPFSITRDETPWRLRHLEKNKPASEQGKNPAPKPTPEHLKGGKEQTEEEAEAAEIEEVQALPDLNVLSPRGSGSVPLGAGPAPEADAGWEDPEAELGLGLGLEQAPPVADEGAGTGEGESSRTRGQEEDGDGWEDPEEELGLGVASDPDPDPDPDPQDPEYEEPRDPEYEGLADPILIGRELAMELAVHVGARVQLITPVGRMTPAGRVPGLLATRVGGVFYSGMYEYDRKNVYLPLDVAQRFLRSGDRITGIEVKLHDIDNLARGKAEVEAALASMGRDDLIVETWQDLNRNLFSAMFLEKIAMFVALLFVVLVASFGILASNLMSVLEKAKEIAIMKAMGAKDALIQRVFVAEGLCLGLVGSITGIILGLALCWALDRYGFPLNENVYYIEKLPVVVNPIEITIVGVAAMLIVWASSLYPAKVASRMRPVDGLRQSEK